MKCCETCDNVTCRVLDKVSCKSAFKEYHHSDDEFNDLNRVIAKHEELIDSLKLQLRSRPSPAHTGISNIEFAKGLAECLGNEPEEHEECNICPLRGKCIDLHLGNHNEKAAIVAATHKRYIEKLDSLCDVRTSRYQDPEEPEDRREFLRGMMEGAKMARSIIQSLRTPSAPQEERR